MTMTALGVMAELANEDRADVIAITIAAVMTLSLTDGVTPRDVADSLFSQLPDDEMWRKGVGNVRSAIHELRDTHLADWIERHL